MSDWCIEGAGGKPIRGSRHASTQESPRAVAIIAHGFKGYKDYGFIPVLARELALRAPLVVHRFNFSHSGIGDDPATFHEPDLFELDTWNAQVDDLLAVSKAARRGKLPGTPRGLPLIVIGHSRGGVTCLLACGRRGAPILPAAIVTLAAPATCCPLDEAQRAKLLECGWLPSPSSRTGQQLRIGRAWLQEQLDDPVSHELLALCAHIRCPVVAVHGDADTTVPPDSASAIAQACPRGAAIQIEGGDHVFNTPNPADIEAPMPAPLRKVVEIIEGTVSAVMG